MFKPNNLELELDLTSKTIKWVEIKSQTNVRFPLKVVVIQNLGSFLVEKTADLIIFTEENRNINLLFCAVAS